MNYSRFQKLPAEDVRSIWGASLRLSHLREEPVDGDQALDLALRHKIGGYDALFAALAQSLRTVCVTQDKALRKAAPHLMVTLDEYLK
jgi:predicted nucleic acid-binding protein